MESTLWMDHGSCELLNQELEDHPDWDGRYGGVGSGGRRL
jgi:hypothetical protein